MFAAPDHRSFDAFRVMHEVNRVASERAEKIVIDAARRAPATIARHGANKLLAARASENRAAIRTEIADRGNLFQIPGPRDVFVWHVQQRSGRPDINAIVAVRAL